MQADPTGPTGRVETSVDRRPLSEAQLHQLDVQESTELVPHLAHEPDGPETLRSMEPLAHRVALRDARQDRVQPVGPAERDQLLEEGSADPSVSPRLADVDRKPAVSAHAQRSDQGLKAAQPATT